MTVMSVSIAEKEKRNKGLHFRNSILDDISLIVVLNLDMDLILSSSDPMIKGSEEFIHARCEYKVSEGTCDVTTL